MAGIEDLAQINHLYHFTDARNLPLIKEWHSAWHFWWCAAVPCGDSWRTTCCEVFEFSEEFAGSHEKAGDDSAGS
jgi:hypothetical protein